MDSVWLLCISTLCCVLNAFTHNLINLVLSFTHRESIKSRNLRQEMMDIKKEMSQFSMMDEFARHARLQRRLIKLQQEWKDRASSQSSSKMQHKFIITLCARLVTGLILLILLFMYRYEPVLILPSKWLYPVSLFLSWPTRQVDAISLTSWLLICGSTSRHFASLIA